MLAHSYMILMIAIPAQLTFSHRFYASLRYNNVGFLFATRAIRRVRMDNQKGIDMIGRLIGLRLSNCSFSRLRTKIKCYKSHDYFSCQVLDCTIIRIPSTSITGSRQKVASFWGSYHSTEVKSAYSTAPAERTESEKSYHKNLWGEIESGAKWKAGIIFSICL